MNLVTAFDTPVADLPAMVETIKKYKARKPIDRSELPEFLYFLGGVPQKKKTLPQVCGIQGGFTLVSQKAVDILQQFDLGATRLHQISIYENDKTTLHSSDHYILNVAETARCFVPERSKYAEKFGSIWRVVAVDEVAVLPNITCSFDLWADPELFEILFVSDRLAKALKAEKNVRFPLIETMPIQVN